MRILHIAECAGGVEKYLRMLLPRLSKKGFSQRLVCSMHYDEECYYGVDVKVNRIMMEHSMNLSNVVRSISSIKKEIKGYDPDIIYCHSSFAGFFGRIAAMGSGKVVVYNPHGWAFDMKCGKMSRILYKMIEKCLSHVTDAIVNISQNERSSALRENITRDNKIVVIYNGIGFERSELEPLTRENLSIPADAFVVGMAGRISRQKSPDIFIKVGAILKKYIPKLHLLIIGDGEARSQIVDLAQSLGVSDILSITGWVDNAEPYLGVLDVGVLLSRWEGFGLVLPEYAKAHVPVVATAVGAIGEVIENGKSGILVAPEDVSGTVNAILKLYEDSSLRESMIAYGYERAFRKFSIDRVVDEHARLFKRLCSRKCYSK